MARMSAASKALRAMVIASAVASPIGTAFAQPGTIKPIMLKGRSEILDAAAVNDAINALSRDADSCTPRTQACICSLTAGVDRLENAYRSAVDRHPRWGEPNTGVEYENLTGGGTVGIVMPNVKRELAMCGRQ